MYTVGGFDVFLCFCDTAEDIEVGDEVDVCPNVTGEPRQTVST